MCFVDASFLKSMDPDLGIKSRKNVSLKLQLEYMLFLKKATKNVTRKTCAASHSWKTKEVVMKLKDLSLFPFLIWETVKQVTKRTHRESSVERPSSLRLN